MAGCSAPATPESVADGSYFLDIDYRAIFPFAVEKMTQALDAVVSDCGHGLDVLDWVIAHQTGVNITQAIAERTGIPDDRFLMTLSHTGNTSGATIPVALDQFNREGWLGPRRHDRAADGGRRHGLGSGAALVGRDPRRPSGPFGARRAHRSHRPRPDPPAAVVA